MFGIFINSTSTPCPLLALEILSAAAPPNHQADSLSQHLLLSQLQLNIAPQLKQTVLITLQVRFYYRSPVITSDLPAYHSELIFDVPDFGTDGVTKALFDIWQFICHIVN